MSISAPRESHGAFKIVDTDMTHFADHRSVGHPTNFYHESCMSSYQAGFNRIPWDFGVYGVDPYYQALFTYRGFASSPPFFPRSFKSFYVDEEKPNQSYIGLIGQAIMSSQDKKMVLSDIYKWVLTHYPYFRNKGPGWKNSVRHNLSLNDCFVKAGRSPNGKGNYWAINPENYEDFRKGDFRRRRAQRRNRKSGQNIESHTATDDVSTSKSEQTTRRSGDEDCAEKQITSHLDTNRLTPKEDSKIRTFDVENLLRVETTD